MQKETEGISVRKMKGQDIKESRYTSPPSGLPIYELKMLQQYIHGINLKNLGESLPERKKDLMLIKFFKHKRNQQVEVDSQHASDETCNIGKVSVVGRNFVMLTTLKDRTWIPYSRIQSARVPFGLPDVSNNHQHVIYDDDLRHKLLTQFGKTVSGKEILKQQFFEESLDLNLQTWKNTRVRVFTNTEEIWGKISKVDQGVLTLRKFKTHRNISIAQIDCIKTVRIYQMIPFLISAVKRLFKK